MQTASPGISPFFHGGNDCFQQYILVVQPDEEVGNRMLFENRECTNKYGKVLLAAARPHIVIADFMAKEAMEETLLRWMQRIYCRQQRFRVTLDAYSGLPPQTICAKVQNPVSLLAIAQPLSVIDSYISAADCPPVRVAARPYLLLARLSSPEDYQQAMKAYALKTFRESFMVNEVVLLKRNLHQEVFSRVHVFRFLPEEGG